MTKQTSSTDVAFTDSVKEIQTRKGSRAPYAKLEQRGGWKDRVTPELAAFLAERDSFYLATANALGQPYVQHRGGPRGFLRVLDERTLAFADFRGNRQYISQGNLAENERAFLFLMDYARRRRIKIWGRARVVEDDPALLERLADPVYEGRPEQAIVFQIEAWDVNCPQHIPQRFDAEQVTSTVAALQARIAELERENARLRRDG
ncbi:MAG TPA: pyridoxamine 5'-phosphate oxidase family protein [Myxococcota bacterium]|jgi:predicted pyridoxine 5'-phosphate oxidase superfamily flavin-nucleotide-binding protein|nr:pyridoxamine 5'-phosphate oxidase family protein [Myxococcota bacterium]